MPETMKATCVLKVPLGAVLRPSDVINRPTVGQQLGDPWVFVGPETEIDLTAWPADRIVLTPVKGKPPEKRKGAGKLALDKMIGRKLLVPVEAELRPDPVLQRTHAEADMFGPDGKTITEEIHPPPPEEIAESKAQKRGRRK